MTDTEADKSLITKINKHRNDVFFLSINFIIQILLLDNDLMYCIPMAEILTSTHKSRGDVLLTAPP